MNLPAQATLRFDLDKSDPRPRPQLSVVLPCYNEAEVLPQTCARVQTVCQNLNCDYEIVLVNDGSADQTWDLMQAVAAADPHFVLVNLSRNHGHQLALMAGLHVASGERIAMLDADLQDPPELLPEMLGRMDDGFEVVYAQRRTRYGDGRLKRLACFTFYRILQSLSETKVPLDSGDFRVVSRRVLEVIKQMPERSPFVRGMVAWAGFQQSPYLYDRDSRQAGVTKYPLSKLVKLAVDGVTSSSVRPLRFATTLGGLSFCVGLLMVIYSLYSWIYVGRTPAGWTSLIITITFFSSVQLMVLGILGEYISRMYENGRQRPLFVIDQVVTPGRAPSESNWSGSAVDAATAADEPLTTSRDAA